MKRYGSTGICLSLLLALGASTATADVLEEFLFDDPAGTAYNAAANSVSTHLFDTDVDLDGVTTNGSGQLNASLKANNEFGTVYVDMDLVETGVLYGEMRLTYAFDEATLDMAENEEIRLSLIQFDPRSTFVTAEFELQREDDNTLTLLGAAAGTGASIDGVTLPSLTQQGTPLRVVMVADLEQACYEVHYSLDGGASFNSIGIGELDPTRDVESLRLTLNNDLSDDAVLLDYLAVANVNPYPGLIPEIVKIPEPAAAASLLLAAVACTLRRRRDC